MNSPYIFYFVHRIVWFSLLLIVSSISTAFASQESNAVDSVWLNKQLEKSDQLLCAMGDAGNTFFVARGVDGNFKTGELVNLGKPGREFQVSTVSWVFKDKNGNHRQQIDEANTDTVTGKLKLMGDSWYWEKLRFPKIDTKELEFLFVTYRYQVVSEKQNRKVSCKINLVN